MSNLFAAFDPDDDDKKKSLTNWLTIGASYDEGSKKKKDTKPEETQPTPKEGQGFFNIGQRMTARDLIDLDESDSSEDRKRKQKKKKKKDKKKKKYNPVFYLARISWLNDS